MLEIFIAAIVGYIFFVEVCVLFQREFHPVSAAIGFAYLLIVASLASANFEFGLFEQKFASEFSFDVFKGRESLRANSTFWLQAMMCSPAYLITDSWWAAIGTNVAVTATIFYFVHSKNRWLSLVLFAPAIINFCLFALRDPIIAGLAFFVTLVFLGKQLTDHWIGQGILTSLFALIRPENIAIFAYSKLLLIVNEKRRSALLYFSFPILIGLGIAVAAFSPQLLGIEFEGSLSELPNAANEFYNQRASRWDNTSDGGGSNILGGRIYSMPLFLRYPIQVFTFFVLPLPFEIRHVGLALAFVDSLVFCGLYFLFHNKTSHKALIIFWVYVLVVAFFSTNYGNVFRLRLPAYFIMLAGFLRR